MHYYDFIREDWYFQKGEHICTSIEETKKPEMQSISIPHTYNAHDGQDGGNDYYRGKASYIRELVRPDVGKDYCFYLEFKGVNSVAEVYADGQKLAEHRGGYSTFRVNVTEYFAGKNSFILTVVADNANHSDVYPQMADFTFYGGIYREVKLIAVPKTHFDLDFYGSEAVKVSSKIDGNKALVTVDAYISNAEQSDMVQVLMQGEEDVYEAFMPANEVTQLKLCIDNPHLWQGITDPYLYSLSIRLIRHNEVLDERTVSHGIREYRVDPDHGFFLNGIPTPLRGVSRHQDRLGAGNALEYVDHYEDIDLIKEMGANTIRLAHYQQNSDFYELCDEYGFVVWAEIPFISMMNKDPNAHENCISQMKELIYQNYNHSSICFWGISNEITIGSDSPELYRNLCELHKLVKELDPSRLSTMAQVSMLPKDSPQNEITDTLSYNLYFGWYGGDYTQNEVWMDEFHAMHPNRPFGLSEYGCEGIISWHSDEPKCRDYSEEYQALYHEHMAKIISEREYLWATHIWNMFDFGCDMRDEGGVRGRNNKGMVTFDRQIKKDSFYIYKAYWTKEPFAHIAGRRFALRAGDTTQIKVYSNQAKLALFVNGEEVETISSDKVFIFSGIKLREGANFILVRDKEQVYDRITLTKVDEPYAGYVKPIEEDEVRDGVKNWFEDVNINEDVPDLTFNAGYFSIKDSIGEILAHETASDVLVDALNAFGSMRVKKSMLGLMSGLSVEEVGGMFAQQEEKAKCMMAWTNFKLQEVKK